MEWTQQNLWRLVNNIMYQTKPNGSSKVEINFSWRNPNKIVPIIYCYPNNRTICDEVTIELEDN